MERSRGWKNAVEFSRSACRSAKKPKGKAREGSKGRRRRGRKEKGAKGSGDATSRSRDVYIARVRAGEAERRGPGEEEGGIPPFSCKWSPRALWGFSWRAISTYYNLVARGPPSLT